MLSFWFLLCTCTENDNEMLPDMTQLLVTAFLVQHYSDMSYKSCWWAVLMMIFLNLQMWIAKAEYDESGPSIVHRKCF